MVVPWRMLLAAVLLLPTGVEADWLQVGGDAARTGMVDGPGPAHPDQALFIDVEGSTQTYLGWPVIIGSRAYFLWNSTAQYALYATGGIEGPHSALMELDLEDASLRPIAEFDWPFLNLASDGDLLFAVGRNRVMAYSLSDDAVVWDRWVSVAEVPTDEPGISGVEEMVQDVRADLPQVYNGPLCGAPDLAGQELYFACSEEVGARRLLLLFGLNTTDGGDLWPPFKAELVEPKVPCDDVSEAACVYRWPGRNPFDVLGPQVAHISVVGPNVLVPTRTVADTGNNPEAAYSGYVIYSVARATGNGTFVDADFNHYTPGAETAGIAPQIPGPPTGDDRFTFVRTERLARYPSGNVAWMSEETERPVYEAEYALASGFAYDGQRLYALTAQTVYCVGTDLENYGTFAPYRLPNDEVWAAGPLALFDGLLVARATRNDVSQEGPSVFYAFDAMTGALVWRHALPEQVSWAASDKAIVAIARTGKVWVLGASGMSPEVVVDASSRYPALGETVRVDLSDSQPGALGAPKYYRAEWGDGTTTDWTSEPRLSHKYLQVSDQAARFFVRNEANQTNSAAVTFFVGQHDPTIQIWDDPFGARYENQSYFFLGLIATALVALFGFYRTGRKRRLLQRELRDLETDVKRLRGTDACETMLAERRARARSLFLQKRLEEAHSSFLERRIDEVQRSIRVGAVDEQLRFLSHGLVLRLKRLLADARVDALERADFIDALERERLPPKEREQVRRLIESWFLRDEEVRA